MQCKLLHNSCFKYGPVKVSDMKSYFLHLLQLILSDITICLMIWYIQYLEENKLLYTIALKLSFSFTLAPHMRQNMNMPLQYL